MPVDLISEVYGSTLRDRTHKGPVQGGNKSLLSYRADIGVPNYTGFIPGSVSVPLPVKNFERTGRPVDLAFKDAAVTTLVDGKPKMSEYVDKFRKNPDDTRPTDRTGGGYWFSQRQLTQAAPFLSTTTYRAEVLNSPENTAKQMERTVGLACTIANYEAARQSAPRSQSADPSLRRSGGSLATTHRSYVQTSPTQRPATALTTYGELVGYQTTTGAMYVQSPLTGGSAAPGVADTTRRPHTTPGEMRYQIMPRAMPPGMYGTASSYRRDFGEDASDPTHKSAPSEKFQTRMGTTRELSEGTTRNTNNLPGYTGHIAAYKYNALAKAQSDAADERINAKNDMTLFALDQFPRTRLPGYTGYKPQAARNITLEQPSHGPTLETTSGSANYMATKNGVPTIDNQHYLNSRTGLMTFFNSNCESVSDNGVSNAQQYFKHARPGDGRVKMSTLPHATVYGAKFNARNSIV